MREYARGRWMKSVLLSFCVLLAATAIALATENKTKAPSPSSNAPVAAAHSAQDDLMRLEGETRFRSNCGRCHAAPSKFPPRMMATIVRHMRVRATITDEDMRLILYYMTQ